MENENLGKKFEFKAPKYIDKGFWIRNGIPQKKYETTNFASHSLIIACDGTDHFGFICPDCFNRMTVVEVDGYKVNESSGRILSTIRFCCFCENCGTSGIRKIYLNDKYIGRGLCLITDGRKEVQEKIFKNAIVDANLKKGEVK